jgi:hypothetical protein
MGCSSGVVIAPSVSTLAPLIRGEPDMVGLLLGSRELLCLSSRISRTLVSCRSLSELYLTGESVSCQIQGNTWAGGVTSLLSPRKTGGVFRGARHVGTSRRRRVIQGTDTSSRPLPGTGARHVTSLPPDRVATHHVVAAYQGTMSSLWLSVGKFLPRSFYLADSIRCSCSVDEFFFPFSITVFVTEHTLTHLQPGSSGVTGFMGSLLDLMWQTLGS